ncbi:hypothetical protein FCM35_KLT20353 [Carex littledalei]|uniref:Uncharacterized protein n=1 Tax=Carex littledalei TaxID=544730 RepID=A0A833VEG4_9POAL|nr:hypothetical protein FCM35_KLT20353 [Carex littledalei]
MAGDFAARGGHQRETRPRAAEGSLQIEFSAVPISPASRSREAILALSEAQVPNAEGSGWTMEIILGLV